MDKVWETSKTQYFFFEYRTELDRNIFPLIIFKFRIFFRALLATRLPATGQMAAFYGLSLSLSEY
jgi:hypothetical protein